MEEEYRDGGITRGGRIPYKITEKEEKRRKQLDVERSRITMER